MIRTARWATLSLLLLIFAAPSTRAQVRAYYYGRPTSLLPDVTEPPERGGTADVVYGSGQGRPVAFGTPGAVYYAPGYALSTYYRAANATYTPPGFFDPPRYDTPTSDVKPNYTYTPGYYSYSYRPAPEGERPRPAGRVLFGRGETYR